MDKLPSAEEKITCELHPKSDEETWPFERLRRYIALARSAIDPTLSPEAEGLIRAYYQLRRRRQEDFRGRLDDSTFGESCKNDSGTRKVDVEA